MPVDTPPKLTARQQQIFDLVRDSIESTGSPPTRAEIAQQLRHEGVQRIAILSDNPDFHSRLGGFPPGTTIGHRDGLDDMQRELRDVKGVSALIYEQTCAAEKRRRIEHLQPWIEPAHRALQHAHAFHMRYYYSALETAKVSLVTIEWKGKPRKFYRLAASVHYDRAAGS